MTPRTKSTWLTGLLGVALLIFLLAVLAVGPAHAQRKKNAPKAPAAPTAPAAPAPPPAPVPPPAHWADPDVGSLSIEKLERGLEKLKAASARIDDKELARIEASVQDALSKARLHSEAALRSLENTKQAEAAMRQAEIAMRNSELASKSSIAASVEAAKSSLASAETLLQRMKEGLKEMEADGLIQPGDKVRIEWEGDTLILNGVRQSEAVSAKYKKWFSDLPSRRPKPWQ